MKKLLLLLILPALAFAVSSCGGSDSGSDEQPAPHISGITTDYDGKAVAGMPVQINGSNFSPKASDNKVLYGVGLQSTSLEVTEASESRLVFIAPDLSKDALKIRVSTKGKESNSVVLEFTELPKPGDDDPWDDTPTIKLEGAKTVKICEGVEWTTFHGTWEGKIRNINIVRTTLNEHNSLGIYFNYSHNGLDDLDQKCEYLDAVAGTNGPMACCHFVRVDGVIKHTPDERQPWVVNSAITIDDGKVNIVKVKDNFDAQKLPNKNVGCAGPLLVWEGEVQKITDEWRAADTDKWLTTTHPRTAIGLSKDGKTVIQVAVDGRWSKTGWPEEQTAIGMSTELLGKLMRGLGCYKAMNFDGGGGTAMWVYGQGNSRNIVNHVSENRWDWNGTTLRPTGNAVYIKSDLKK